MIVVHVVATCSPDYLTRREAHRPAHIERLGTLRSQGRLIGGGPAADARTAELFYRLREAEELKPIVEEDPYFTSGSWTGYTSRSFGQFVEPWEQVPVVLDGSRRATIVEGPATDPDLAQLALVELRGAGRLRFGGSFDGRDTLAVLGSAEASEAAGWLTATGLWSPAELESRPWLHVI
jgi:uncharacterized protein YciI